MNINSLVTCFFHDECFDCNDCLIYQSTKYDSSQHFRIQMIDINDSIVDWLETFYKILIAFIFVFRILGLVCALAFWRKKTKPISQLIFCFRVSSFASCSKQVKTFTEQSQGAHNSYDFFFLLLIMGIGSLILSTENWRALCAVIDHQMPFIYFFALVHLWWFGAQSKDVRITPKEMPQRDRQRKE